MSNPLTEMTGPHFLVLFAILISVVALVCWWRQWSRDTSAELSPLPSPQTPDPYEIAYLRGGENELARVLIVSPNLFDYADSIELRHAQIEQRHLGSMPLPKLDRFTSVTSLSNNHHV